MTSTSFSFGDPGLSLLLRPSFHGTDLDLPVKFGAVSGLYLRAFRASCAFAGLYRALSCNTRLREVESYGDRRLIFELYFLIQVSLPMCHRRSSTQQKKLPG